MAKYGDRWRVAWMRAYYGQLVGRRIVAVGATTDGVPSFELDNGVRVEVWRDEEGNGPGFLAGLPPPIDPKR